MACCFCTRCSTSPAKEEIKQEERESILQYLQFYYAGSRRTLIVEEILNIIRNNKHNHDSEMFEDFQSVSQEDIDYILDLMDPNKEIK